MIVTDLNSKLTMLLKANLCYVRFEDLPFSKWETIEYKKLAFSRETTNFS